MVRRITTERADVLFMSYMLGTVGFGVFMLAVNILVLVVRLLFGHPVGEQVEFIKMIPFVFPLGFGFASVFLIMVAVECSFAFLPLLLHGDSARLKSFLKRRFPDVLERHEDGFRALEHGSQVRPEGVVEMPERGSLRKFCRRLAWKELTSGLKLTSFAVAAVVAFLIGMVGVLVTFWW